ncbi:hypothetical protein D9M72_538930 [compost metagenome]
MAPEASKFGSNLACLVSDPALPGTPRDRILKRYVGSSSISGDKGKPGGAAVLQPCLLETDSGKSGKTRIRHGAERSLQGFRFGCRGPLCWCHSCADERLPFEDARCWRHRQSREKPPGQDRSSGHRVGRDEQSLQGSDADRIQRRPDHGS